MADTKEAAIRKIKNKYALLRFMGLDLGSIAAPLKSVGWGGYMQKFARGRIYSHYQVGTFEVHGGILQKYISRNQFGVHPKSGVRELGFPISDEENTPDGLYRRNRFESGEIIYVSGTGGGVSISGKIYRAWNKDRRKKYGYPISSNTPIASGDLVLFQHGIAYQGKLSKNEVVWISLNYPLLGAPDIQPTSRQLLAAHISIEGRDFDQLGSIWKINSILKSILFLRAVGKDHRVGLKLSNKMKREKGRWFDPFEEKVKIYLATLSPSLKNRTLYDFYAKIDGRQIYRISPHAIYAKDSWKNFGLIHATDIHVAKRIDGFKGKMARAKRLYPGHSRRITLGIDSFNNWNNGFRDLIRYANYLHAQGQVDGIIATGDLIDYIYEKNDVKGKGGNFKFFIDLILGKSPYPERDKKHEELLVPIFTTPGNHDYRARPYELYGRVDITLYPDQDIKQYSGYNLTKFDARIVQGGNPLNFPSSDDNGRIKFDTDVAKRQVIPVKELTYYNKYINRKKNSLHLLGKHSLILLDTGPDKGAPDGSWDTWDVIATKLGFGSEDEEAFYEHHAPNSVGPSKSGYRLLAKASQRPGHGLIIIGMHAPALNPMKNEYPHYFREMEHTRVDLGEIEGFLRRHTPSLAVMYEGPWGSVKRGRAYIKNYFKDWWHRAAFFKYGKHSNLLDYGVSRGPIDEFLKMCCGQNSTKVDKGETLTMHRPVDLVLSGHDHTMAEMRVRWNGKRLEFYHDYYTQNHPRYYPSKKSKKNGRAHDLVQLKISSLASLNSRPTSNGRFLRLTIPPYYAPLSEASNKTKWWRDHRPLFIQGAPLGPTDKNNRLEDPSQIRPAKKPISPSFEGCKLIIVRNDVIQQIIQVSRKELEKTHFVSPLKVRPIPSREMQEPITY